ncbi:MAG: hypothetical protein BWZ02_00260 [Lentisphaerae bacterium ADurb.BinA184]|nr:MAG: hypothetical protein BWZ02_00260 [Lentisphaerae bacterium ADurb.BinA184]
MDTLMAYVARMPGWLVAVIVVVAGWLAALVARVVLARVLALFRFNRLCGRLGLCDFLRKGDVTLTPSEVLGRGAFWVILGAALLKAAALLDVAAAETLRQRAVAALPALVSGGLVFVVGLLLVAFVAGFVRTVARNAGSPYAELWGRVTRWAGGILMLAVAIEQAEVRGSVLAGVLYIVTGAGALGLALAFGLGCKDMARESMKKWMAEMRERHRDASHPDLEG